jgi:hypothetical protein
LIAIASAILGIRASGRHEKAKEFEPAAGSAGEIFPKLNLKA